ncbi:MAG TPA: hypothetical protein VF522_18970 [Ramlibacter sp.]|uniref:hypothetical protein n=1 Tax=Ramlibacter sp. TaxID=1917967 RepID=UPI002ED135C8
MNQRTFITPEDAAELRHLTVEYERAFLHAVALLKTGGESFTGERLRLFLEADAKTGEIVRRIKEIQGTAGLSWDA